MVEAAQEKADFYWLTSDGQRLSGSERQLRAALTSGALQADCLVWRKGWAEWQPARDVAELAGAVPAAPEQERKSAPRKSRPSASSVQLPPLVARNPVTTARPSPAVERASLPDNAAPTSRVVRAKLESREAPGDTLAPPPAPSSFGTLGQPRGVGNAPARHESGPPPPPVRARAPLPTLTEEDGPVSATATLRPPGAVPPPPRGVPTPPFDTPALAVEHRAAARTPAPVSGALAEKPERLVSAPTAALPVSPPASSSARTIGASARDAPEVSRSLPLLIEPLPEQAPVSFDPALDSSLEVTQSLPANARDASVEPVAARRAASSDFPTHRSSRDFRAHIGVLSLPGRRVLMALSGLSAALLVAVIALVWSRGSAVTAPPVASRSAGSASLAPVPAPTSGCRLALPAARIYANVERSVLPSASNIPGESALALGFASSKTEGVGLRLSSETLDATPAFDEEGKEAVRGVVPSTRSGTLAFFVDRDETALRAAHTVDEVPPFTLGLSQAGFARVIAGNASLVWPLDSRVKITEPRSAPAGAFGYGVTFRQGGQSGSVVLGFVGGDGSKKSELREIANAPKLVGTPMIAGSAEGVLVAFAGRDEASAPWQIFASLTAPGAAPTPARAIVGGAGGGAISPALSPFEGNRWLVQWTEGGSGQYQVHAQLFAADLSPIAHSVLASPKGANAGQGLLSAFTGGALSLFILTTAGHDELWGATLSCP